MRREAEKVLRDKVTKESESPGNGVCPASAVLHFALELGDKGEGLLSFSPFQNDYISVRKNLLQPLVMKGGRASPQPRILVWKSLSLDFCHHFCCRYSPH